MSSCESLEVEPIQAPLVLAVDEMALDEVALDEVVFGEMVLGPRCRNSEQTHTSIADAEHEREKPWEIANENSHRLGHGNVPLQMRDGHASTTRARACLLLKAVRVARKRQLPAEIHGEGRKNSKIH